jgi:hypothetical protein
MHRTAAGDRRQAEGHDRVGDGKSQAEPGRLQDLHLLDGLLARGRQDAQCALGERQEDEGRGDLC